MDPYVMAALIAVGGTLATVIAARFFVPLLPPSDPVETKETKPTAAE